jgi:hypothetical protein
MPFDLKSFNAPDSSVVHDIDAHCGGNRASHSLVPGLSLCTLFSLVSLSLKTI